MVTISLTYYHSDNISAEDCGLFEETMNANCPGAVLTVQFQKADGTALPTPFRVGKTGTVLSGTPINRKQSLKAMVTPAAEAANITIGVSNKLQKSNVIANPSTGIITFDVVGITQSMDPGDATITANRSGTAVKTAPVSVVVPNNVSATHDTNGGGVVIANRVLDATTAPPIVCLPAGQVKLFTMYLRNLSITVCDQFGDLIGSLYQGAEISEFASCALQYLSINQQLSSASTYIDPVGWGTYGVTVAAGSSQATNWPSAGKVAASIGCLTGNQTIDVKVDGFLLTPSIVNRTVDICGNGSATTSPPVTLTITWP